MYKKKVYFLQNYIHYSRQFVNVTFLAQFNSVENLDRISRGSVYRAPSPSPVFVEGSLSTI